MSVGLLQERPPYVRFEIGTVEARDENGLPIIKDVANILVTPAGSKDVHIAVADEWIKAKEQAARKNPPEYNPDWAVRFRQSFELWSRGQEIPEFGTPVRTWPALSPAEVRRCVDANVLTVEDLAGANQQCLDRLGMGSVALKQKAATWLADRTGTEAATEVSALKVKLEAREQQIADLSTTVAALSARLDELTAAPKRGRKERDHPGLHRDDEDALQ